MKNKSMLTFGPGAASLILIVVILCMSVLGMLALMSARADVNLSDHSAEVIQAVYQLNAQAEETLSQLDQTVSLCRLRAADEDEYLALLAQNLPLNMALNGREITWTESDGLRQLNCTVQVLPLSGTERTRWTAHSLTAVTEEIWN